MSASDELPALTMKIEYDPTVQLTQVLLPQAMDDGTTTKLQCPIDDGVCRGKVEGLL